MSPGGLLSTGTGAVEFEAPFDALGLLGGFAVGAPLLPHATVETRTAEPMSGNQTRRR